MITIITGYCSYSGNCKNGLAGRKGVAQGIGYYEGQFNKGMPDGKGMYKCGKTNDLDHPLP